MLFLLGFISEAKTMIKWLQTFSLDSRCNMYISLVGLHARAEFNCSFGSLFVLSFPSNPKHVKLEEQCLVVLNRWLLFSDGFLSVLCRCLVIFGLIFLSGFDGFLKHGSMGCFPHSRNSFSISASPYRACLD